MADYFVNLRHWSKLNWKKSVADTFSTFLQVLLLLHKEKNFT